MHPDGWESFRLTLPFLLSTFTACKVSGLDPIATVQLKPSITTKIDNEGFRFQTSAKSIELNASLVAPCLVASAVRVLSILFPGKPGAAAIPISRIGRSPLCCLYVSNLNV